MDDDDSLIFAWIPNFKEHFYNKRPNPQLHIVQGDGK